MKHFSLLICLTFSYFVHTSTPPTSHQTIKDSDAVQKALILEMLHREQQGMLPKKNKDGLTLLQYTVAASLSSATHALVEAQVNLNEFSGDHTESDPISVRPLVLPLPRYAPGWTALHFAAHVKNCMAMAILLDGEADIHAQTKNEGLTALHIATYANHPECIALLMNRGADPFALSLAELSPLLCAAQRGSINTFKILAEKAESDSSFRKKLLESKTGRGETLFELAHKGNQPEITSYLAYLQNLPCISSV